MNQRKTAKQAFGLLCLLFLVSFPLQAQKDFRPGYIITNEYDTIHGLIDYRGDIRNSKECAFKKGPDASLEIFFPFDIKGYRFSGSKFYISKMIPVKDGKKAVFVEYLVDGIVKLYYYRDVNMDHYFIEKEDGKLYELTNDTKILQTQNGSYIQESKKYIGIMKMVFKDCPSIYPEINKAEFNDKSFIKIAVDYHNEVCEGEKCIVYKKQLPRIRFRVAPYGGFQLLLLQVKEGGVQFFSKMDFTSGYSFSTGISMSFSLPRVNDKLSFNIRGSLYKTSFYANYTTQNQLKTSTTYYETTIGFSAAKISTLFSYTYPVGKYRPVFSLGLSSNILLHRSSDIVEETERDNVINTRQYSIIPFGGFYLCPFAEAGMTTTKVLKKFPLFFNVSYGYSFVTNPVYWGETQVRGNFSTITILTGIWF